MPSSTLKQRYNALAYHRVREALVADHCFRFIRGEFWADILTNLLAPHKFFQLLKQILMKCKMQGESNDEMGVYFR